MVRLSSGLLQQVECHPRTSGLVPCLHPIASSRRSAKMSSGHTQCRAGQSACPHISSTVSNTSKGPVPPQKVESQYIHLHSLFKTERRSRKFEPRWRVNTPMIFQTGPFCARSNRCPIPDDHALKSLTQTSSDGLLADFCDCGLPLPALPARLTLRLRGGVSPETGARGSKPGV